jgi:hypothetical protein
MFPAAGEIDIKICSSTTPPPHFFAVVLLIVLLQIFKDVYDRLSKLRKAAEQRTSHNPLPGSTQLQLGLTTAALLQLHPQVSHGTRAAAAAAAGGTAPHDGADDEVAAELQHYRLEMLSLLCSDYHALRIKAGPLAAQVVTDAANTAAAAAAAGGEVAGSSSGAVAAAVTAAMAEVQQQLLLQRSVRPDQQQAELLQLLQLPLDLLSPEQEETKKGLQRSLKSQVVCWDSVFVQIADVAAAATAAASAAVRLEEAPNTLDALLLQLVCGHAAFVQQLPADLLPTYELCETDSKASQMRLAAAALDVLAGQQQYSSRFGYLAYHAPAWIWQWFNSGRSFDQLLLLQPLLCPQQSGGSGSTGGADACASSKADASQLLDCYGSSIMCSLMQAEADQELQAVADAAGSSTAALVDRWCWQITATLYPALTRPFKSDATAAKAGEIAERMNLKSKVG